MNLLIRIFEMPMGPAVLLLLGIAVYYLAGIKRTLADYPPHRHEGKKIFYPKGMAPEKAQEMEEPSKAGA